MVWFKQQYLWMIISAAAVCVSCQELTSTLRNGNYSCQGEWVTFTCTIRSADVSTLILAWSSIEYIGQGVDPLRFTTQDTPGENNRTSTINGNVIAILTNNANINGMPTLVSELHIVADRASTVTCASEATSGTMSQVFTVSAVPGVPQRISAAEISRPRNDICFILVQWDPPVNSDPSEYIVYVPSRNIIDVSSSILTTLTVTNCGDDIRVLVAAMNRDGCVGMNSSEVLPLLLDIPTTSASNGNGSATTEGGSAQTEGGSAQTSTSAIAAASVAAVLFIILCVVVVLGLVLFSVLYKRDKKIQDAEQDLQNRLQDVLVKSNLEELYNALKLKLAYRNTIQAAARDLKTTLMGTESSKFNENIKDALISYLEKLQSENREDVQRVTENMDTILTGMTGIDEEFKTSVRLLRTEVGAGEYTKVLNDLIKKVEKVQPDTIVRILRILCENLWKIRQVKDYYCKQSKHDVSDLGTEEDRVSVPIWMDDELDGGWKAGLREAVKAINEAAPGLSLLIIEDKKKAIIHALAIDKKEPYTEVEGNILIRSSTENFVTKIRLGKIWKDDEKKGPGVCSHELLHALGFHHEHQHVIAAPYVYHLDSGKEITINKNDLCFIQWKSSTTTLYPCEKKCRGALSEGHVCKWVLEAYPTKMNTDLNEHDMVGLNLVYPPCVDKTANNVGYRPKLGRNGMYYCGREVMIGLTFHGEEYDHLCGPDKGPNCPACRTIMSPRVEEILEGGRWQGVTGRVYCGRPFAEPGILFPTHNGMCGIDNGPACPDCNNILNKEHVQSVSINPTCL